MKQKIIILSLFLLVSCNICFAQYVRFVTDGVIEFEKSVNMYALIKKDMADNAGDSFWQQAYEQYVKSQPQFLKMKSTLTFSKNITLFKPAEEQEGNQRLWSNDPMVKQNNSVYSNLSAGTSIIQKHVYEETFLVKDSIRRINWKITDQTREIAGYQCRRANALILDSIYVVAFYTDKIPVSGGPESFSGLPGMILGVALPHENITWFATKVSDQSVLPNALAAPAKGKQVNSMQLRETIMSALKDWGNYAKKALKAFLL